MVVGSVTHDLDSVELILIGWLVVSLLVTPLVGRFLGHRFSDPAKHKSKQPLAAERMRETAEL